MTPFCYLYIKLLKIEIISLTHSGKIWNEKDGINNVGTWNPLVIDRINKLDKEP
jgi:hypothetical protein